MSSLPGRYRTSEEYLELEREAEYRSEYINGLIAALPAVSRERSLIASNLVAAIGTQLADQTSVIYGSDMRVKGSPTRLYTYPDVTVVCGEPQFDDEQSDTLTNPTVIIEVLPPSLEGYARHIKFAHYRELASLTDYVLISEDTSMVEHFVRSGDDWTLTKLSDHDSVLSLASIGCDMKLRDIYDGLEFPSKEAAG